MCHNWQTPRFARAVAMQCTLLIPDLFWPRETAAGVTRDLDLPALTRLLARARAERHPALTIEAWLCGAFEVEREQDWPVAPLTLAIDGGEPGSAYWLRADPVHLKVERSRLLLVDNALFDITPAEAQTLAGFLNAHFAAEGIEFQPRAPKRWYVSVPRAPQLVTHSPFDAAGKDVRQYLPSGADALDWHRRFNEVQMLLHEHAVNEAREARGEPAVNSVWFWGGGTRPRARGGHFSAVWSDDALACALATVADTDAHGLPADAASWLAVAVPPAPDERAHLVVLGQLSSAMRYGDSDAWRARARELETQWLAPLATALRQGRLSHLTIVVPGAESCWRFALARGDLLKFWRGTKPLAAYA